MQNQKTRNLKLGVEIDKKSLTQAETELRKLLGPAGLGRLEEAQAREARARAKQAEDLLARQQAAAQRRAQESAKKAYEDRLRLEVSQGKASQEHLRGYLKRIELDETLSDRRRLSARREYLKMEQAEERRARAGSFGSKVNTLVRSTRFEPGRGIQPLLGRTADVFGMGGVALTASLGIVNELTKKASDLNETISKSGFVFGSSAASIAAWGETSAKAFGLSKQAAIEQAATLGNLLRGVGLTQAQSADQSKLIVGLAADLSSFNNVAGGSEEVLHDLRSALVGESEPVRKYGILLNEAAVKAEALRLGLVKSTGSTAAIAQAQRTASIAQAEYSAAVKRYGENSIEAQKKLTTYEKAQAAVEKATKGTMPALTEQQKVMARLSLLFAQTKTAQRDFARTAGDAANAQRILNAELDNLQARLGDKLLPLRKGFLTFLIDAADRGGELVTSLEGITKEWKRLVDTGQEGQLPIWLRNMLDASEAIRLNLRTAAQEGTRQGRAAELNQQISELKNPQHGSGAMFSHPLSDPRFAKYGIDPLKYGALGVDKATAELIAAMQRELNALESEIRNNSPQRIAQNNINNSSMMGLGELAKRNGQTLPALIPGTGTPKPPGGLTSGTAAEKLKREAVAKAKKDQEAIDAANDKSAKEAGEILDLVNQISVVQAKAAMAASEAALEIANKRVEKAVESGARQEDLDKLLEELDAKNAAVLLARLKVANEEYAKALTPAKRDAKQAIEDANLRKGLAPNASDSPAVAQRKKKALALLEKEEAEAAIKRRELAGIVLSAAVADIKRDESQYVKDRKAARDKSSRANEEIEAQTTENLRAARAEQAQAVIRAEKQLSEIAIQRARNSEEDLRGRDAMGRERGSDQQRRSAAAGTLGATMRALESQLAAAFTAGDVGAVAETLQAMVEAQRDYTAKIRELTDATTLEIIRIQANTDASNRRMSGQRRAKYQDTYQFDGGTYSTKTNEQVDTAALESLEQLQRGAEQAANTFLRGVISGHGDAGNLWKDIGKTFGDTAGDFLAKKLITGPLQRFFEEIAAKLAASAVAGGGGKGIGPLAGLLPGVGIALGGIYAINQIFGKRSPLKGLHFAGGGTAYPGSYASMAEFGPELAIMAGGRAAMVGESGPAIGTIQERMRILDARTTAHLMSQIGQGSARQVVVSGPIMQVETINDRGDAHYMAQRALDLLMDRSEARGY